jgi:hypothetical protein
MFSVFPNLSFSLSSWVFLLYTLCISELRLSYFVMKFHLLIQEIKIKMPSLMSTPITTNSIGQFLMYFGVVADKLV